MTPEKQIQAAYFYCLATNKKPTRRAIEALLKRDAGHSFRHSFIDSQLRGLRDQTRTIGDQNLRTKPQFRGPGRDQPRGYNLYVNKPGIYNINYNAHAHEEKQKSCTPMLIYDPESVLIATEQERSLTTLTSTDHGNVVLDARVPVSVGLSERVKWRKHLPPEILTILRRRKLDGVRIAVREGFSVSANTDGVYTNRVRNAFVKNVIIVTGER